MRKRGKKTGKDSERMRRKEDSICGVLERDIFRDSWEFI